MKVLKKLSEFWNALHQRERIQDEVQEVRVKTELSFTDDTVMTLAVAKWLMTDESIRMHGGWYRCHINILKKMKEHKYLLLGLSLFFFNICFVSCRNQKAESVVQSDSVGEEESMNSNVLEIIRSQEYVYGGVRMAIDTSFSVLDTKAFPFNDSLSVVTGVQDEIGPTYSFIVNTETKQAILLPSNRGCLGFTSEEGLPICLSFRHYANGDPGRFSVVTVYDERGKLVKEMSLEGYEEEIK